MPLKSIYQSNNKSNQEIFHKLIFTILHVAQLSTFLNLTLFQFHKVIHNFTELGIWTVTHHPSIILTKCLLHLVGWWGKSLHNTRALAQNETQLCQEFELWLPIPFSMTIIIMPSIPLKLKDMNDKIIILLIILILLRMKKSENMNKNYKFTRVCKEIKKEIY